MAFDRTFGFVFTNFSKHQYAWTADGITFNGTIAGIDKIERTCPILIYQIKAVDDPTMLYFVRACANISKLELLGEVSGTKTGVSFLFS